MKPLTKEQFIEKANLVHNFKYDYTKVIYKDYATKVCIVCPEHGEFWQTPGNHLKGVGCPECGKIKSGLKHRTTQENFIKKAKKIHGDKYDYSKVKYVSSNVKVCIICPIHGEFWQTPACHLAGNGCAKCAGVSKLTNDEWVRKAKVVHGEMYDYSKTQYKTAKDSVCIICPKHGEFWQLPTNHIAGAGCPNCRKSKMEEEIKQFLNQNDIVFEEQKTFDWLINKEPMHLDFFLPDYNIGIECQGEQHFKPLDFWGGKEKFAYTSSNDKLKNELCVKNGITIKYYSNVKFENYLYEVFYDKNKLVESIKNENSSI